MAECQRLHKGYCVSFSRESSRTALLVFENQNGSEYVNKPLLERAHLLPHLPSIWVVSQSHSVGACV